MKKLTLLILPLLIVACAGGGGGGGSASSTPLTTFSAVGPNAGPIQATGGSTQVSYAQPAANGPITLTNFLGSSSTGANVTFKTDGSGSPNYINVQSAQGGAVTVDASKGDSFSAQPFGGGVFLLQGVSANRQNEVNVSGGSGWDYQNYGVWATGINSGNGGNAGAVSVGSVTPASGMPTTGTATFTGNTAGYVVISGSPSNYGASMSASVNFGARTINFQTTGTTLADGTALAGGNLTGLFVYGAGSSQFAGAVATVNGGLKGSAAGSFYGPTAQEIGGTYSLSGAVGGMVGAFGGKR